ncbi:tubulin-specific chaperone e [Diplodia corticola]|uniref:Tubulin-specific chaperone E n=1 Tax=Diplodia corticola TaxID=236234 RepID=A0A1J9RDG5_9PEZI|nr:tubulin-specific chaperone e [Diplodia corticola]OJD38576.1 tubulin-specific chaperone e [Diplodia corticola]
MASAFHPGKRLSFNRDLCTVRYVGQVQGTKGEWLGVEWDDPTRGKHDGSHAGVRYFECRRKHPTAGSFVRPNRPSDPPVSYVEALKQKYASEPVEDPSVSNIDIVVFGKAPENVPVNSAGKVIMISGKEAEEVGFDKIRKKLANLKELRIVLLDGMCMERPFSKLFEQAGEMAVDQLTDVKDASPSIQELDLSRNLFEEWREVASICVQLESLRRLKVDGNRLRDLELDGCLSSAFTHVSTLSLEDTLLSWEDVTNMCSALPSLATLSLTSNAFDKLGQTSLPSTITELILEKNYFRSLDDLRCLTKLPNLRSLKLKNNLISGILGPHSAGGEPLVFSDSVSEVDLVHNSIEDWAFIDNLPSVFPGLTSLRISSNPLYHGLQAVDGKPLTADDGYMLTIARLGKLKIMNFSTISAKERLNAETYYLSQIGAELSSAPEGQESKVIATHGRYSELCAEYGEPTIVRLDASAVKPNSLAARLIKFTFYPGNSVKAKLGASRGAAEEFSAELPRSFTVYSMLGVVGKRLAMAPLELRLFWETGDWVPVGEEVAAGGEEWDSSDDEDGKAGEGKVVREVEWVAGTKMVGTWVEGMEARVRIEVQ